MGEVFFSLSPLGGKGEGLGEFLEMKTTPGLYLS